MDTILCTPMSLAREKTKLCIKCSTKFNYRVHNQLYCSPKCKRKDYYLKYIDRERSYYHKDIKFNESKLKKRKEYMKQWRLNNKDKMSKQKRIYYDRRMKEEEIFKLKHNISTRVRSYLKKYNYKKESSIIEILGCSPIELKRHLEKKFTEGMSWEMMGSKIHVDHIIPLASAQTQEEVLKLCHFSNLQPLFARDNLIKGAKIL